MCRVGDQECGTRAPPDERSTRADREGPRAPVLRCAVEVRPRVDVRTAERVGAVETDPVEVGLPEGAAEAGARAVYPGPTRAGDRRDLVAGTGRGLGEDHLLRRLRVGADRVREDRERL